MDPHKTSQNGQQNLLKQLKMSGLEESDEETAEEKLLSKRRKSLRQRQTLKSQIHENKDVDLISIKDLKLDFCVGKSKIQFINMTKSSNTIKSNQRLDTIKSNSNMTKSCKVSFQQHGYEDSEDQQHEHVYLPRFQKSILIDQPAPRKKGLEKVERERSEVLARLHKRQELNEKRYWEAIYLFISFYSVKNRDRDRILHALYLERLEKEEGHHVVDQQQQQQVEKRLNRRVSNIRDAVILLNVKKENYSPDEPILKAADIATSRKIQGPYWREHAPKQFVPTRITAAQNGFKIKFKPLVQNQQHDPVVFERVTTRSRTRSASSSIANHDMQLDVPPIIEPPIVTFAQKKLPTTTATIKPKRSKRILQSSLATSSELDDTQVDSNFRISIKKDKKDANEAGPSSRAQRGSRITTAFGFPLAPMKRLDLDYSDAHWLLLNECGIY